MANKNAPPHLFGECPRGGGVGGGGAAAAVVAAEPAHGLADARGLDAGRLDGGELHQQRQDQPRSLALAGLVARHGRKEKKNERVTVACCGCQGGGGDRESSKRPRLPRQTHRATA